MFLLPRAFDENGREAPLKIRSRWVHSWRALRKVCMFFFSPGPDFLSTVPNLPLQQFVDEFNTYLYEIIQSYIVQWDCTFNFTTMRFHTVHVSKNQTSLTSLPLYSGSSIFVIHIFLQRLLCHYKAGGCEEREKKLYLFAIFASERDLCDWTRKAIIRPVRGDITIRAERCDDWDILIYREGNFEKRFLRPMLSYPIGIYVDIYSRWRRFFALYRTQLDRLIIALVNNPKRYIIPSTRANFSRRYLYP